MEHQCPRDVSRDEAFERLAAGTATERDFVIGLRRPLAWQKRRTATLSLFAAALAIFARSLAPGSLVSASLAAMVILAVTGYRNNKSAQWLYEAWRLLVGQPSSRVAGAGIRLAMWGLLGDIWPMFFAMLVLKQAGISPADF